MDRLVEFLLDGAHPVTFDRYEDASDLAGGITDGVLLMRCTDTRGGTELACELDEASTSKAGEAIGTEPLEIVGALTLNDIDLRANVIIETKELRGQARFARQ